MNKIGFEIIEEPKSKLGRQVGRGQCSQIFSWEDSKVCKLFYEFISPFNFENEYRVCIAAMSAEIPVPAVHGAVKVGSRYGIIFDRVEGINMDIETIFRFWKLEDYMRTFTMLQNNIHKVSAPDNLRSQHDVLEEWINRSTPLSKNQRTAAISALKHLPEGHQLCHGDYHLGNVIHSHGGPAIIDWQTGYAGNRLGDIAMTETILFLPIAPAAIFHIALPFCRKRAALYRQHYQNLSQFNEEEYRIFLFVAAAARISNVLHNRIAVQYLRDIVELQCR